MSKETFTLEEIEELCHHAFRCGKGINGLNWDEYKPLLKQLRENIDQTKQRRNNDNPATEKINDKNNITMENNTTNNPTWVGNWVWTDDKVKEAIQYILYHREKEWYGVSYHLKEFKLNDWFKQIGLMKDRIFESNDEEVTMTSGELKQLIDLLTK